MKLNEAIYAIKQISSLEKYHVLHYTIYGYVINDKFLNLYDFITAATQAERNIILKCLQE